MNVDPYKRVLIVDDDHVVREALASLLRQRGLFVDEAAGGQEALDLLRTSPYTVILLDLLMPQPDGFAVMQAFQDRTIQTPAVVLVVTGADRTVLDRLDSQRIHGVVRKPFDAEELAALVVACTDIRSRGGFGTSVMAMAMLSSARFLHVLDRLI